MATNTINDPTWKSSDYFLTSFLVAKGWRVIGVDGSTTRKVFILSDPDPAQRERLTLNYRLSSGDDVPAHALFDAQKTLQRLLRDGDR